MAELRRLIAGNWKMNGLMADGLARAKALRTRALRTKRPLPDIALCPPATLLAAVGKVLAGSPIALGAQDCHQAEKGAHTGDIAAPMLAELGCRHVIVGHSERRANHGESDAQVRAKAEAALRCGLIPIVCVGESAEQRRAGQHLSVIGGQVERSLPSAATPETVVVAYEPVWAIGTGLTPTPQDIEEAHKHLRTTLDAPIRLLYGGSANAANAKTLLATPGVDGLLVGGASLDADAFWKMVLAA
ncbi:MAG: triose-phosphate isomerase [Alphaproteobacteria bacterium]|nr:triose-phosphate isomerase [Alphaproteobacteria bacterium]